MNTSDAWLYFRMLEGRVSDISRYVYIENDNYSSYSIEVANLIISACVEIENLAKCICSSGSKKGSSVRSRNISEWYGYIVSTNPWLIDFSVLSSLVSGDIRPWVGWSENSSPDWWGGGYNKLKHDRYKCRKCGNVFNMINSMAGLLTMLLCYEKEVNGLLSKSGAQRIVLQSSYCPHVFYPVGGFSLLYYENEHGACCKYDFP
jgi:hypothetical protein